MRRSASLRSYKRAPRSAFRPLSITAQLECGILSDNTLPIDGVLYFLVHRKAYGRQDLTFPGSYQPRSAETVDTSLPLRRVKEHTPMWFYAASFAQWGPVADGQDAWSKRVPVARLQYLDVGKKPSIDISSGQYKAYRMPVFYRHATHVTWYVNGAPDMLRDLLAHATHIGKKTEQGWGSVSGWSVEEVDEDWSVYGPDGSLMRCVPAENGILTGFRPSYWLPQNQTICLFPDGSQQKLPRSPITRSRKVVI